MNKEFMGNKFHEYREIDWESEEVQQCERDLAVIFERHFSKFGRFDFEDMAFRFLRHYQLALVTMWCREEELQKLAKLKHQICQVAETYASIHWVAHVQLQMNATLPLKVANGAYVSGQEYKFTPDFDGDLPAFSAEQGLVAIANHYKDLLPAIEKTSQDLTEGIQYKKRAHEAWRLVSAASELCQGYEGTINVPKALNPTSPFHSLLEDLFVYFEIETTPEGAFKGWYRHVVSKSKS